MAESSSDNSDENSIEEDEDYFDIASLTEKELATLVHLARMHSGWVMSGGSTLRGLARAMDEKIPRLKPRIEHLQKLGLVTVLNGRVTCNIPALIALRLFNARFTKLSATKVVERSFVPVSDLHQPESLVFQVPSSILLGGEHSAVVGHPSVVLPIPLYIRAGVNLVYTDERVDEVDVRPWFGELNQGESLQFNQIKMQSIPLESGLPLELKRQQNFFEETFKERLRRRRVAPDGRNLKKVVVTLQSEIPSKCGLNSSSTIAASIALLLDACEMESPAPVNQWVKSSKEALFADRRFRKVLDDAVKFDAFIQKRPAISNCFASLVGSQNSTPFLFQADRKSGKVELREFTRFPKKFAMKWRDDFGIALVYSRSHRGPNTDKYDDQFYWGKVNSAEVQRELKWATAKLWEELTEKKGPHWSHVITMIQVYASFESGALGRMQSEVEGDLRMLCGYFISEGLGAKYSGTGDGGDLLIVGSPEKLKSAIPHNYFPIHYATYLYPNLKSTVPTVRTLDLSTK